MSVVKLQKGLPYHTEAEQCVLGAVLLDPPFAIPHVLGCLTAEDFHHLPHKAILEAMLNLHRSNVAIDPITVADTVKKESLDSVGGPSYPAILLDMIPTAANVSYYVRILQRETERRKRILKAANEIETAYGDTVIPSKNYVKLADVLEEVLLDSYAIAAEGRSAGYVTGFDNLDRHLGGFYPSEIYVIGGRTSMGKSAMCAQISAYIKNCGGRIAFFPIEVGAHGLARNIAAQENKIEPWKMRGYKGYHQTEDEVRALTAYLTLQKQGRFFIGKSNTIPGIEKALRSIVAEEGGVDILFIDHLQELHTGKPWQKRHYEIEEVLVELRRIAREFNIPIVLAAQINRGAEGREPTLADLKDSGSIEQIADVVMLLHGERDSLERVLNVAKHRNGRTGKIRLSLEGKYLTFTEEG